MLRKTILPCMLLWTCFLNCGNNPTGLPVSASETWRIYDVASSQNYADITLSKLSDSSITVRGSWYYTFFGKIITCNIMSGTATIIDTLVTISSLGTASYPPDSSGHAVSSPFNLQMSGKFKSGISRGTWEINFNDTLWQGWINPGQFSGSLQSGNGVTAILN